MATARQQAEALIKRATDAMRRGDGRAALAALRRAEQKAPGEPAVHLNKALAHRAMGDLDSALQALDATLALDPYNFPALLTKGSVLERQGLRQRAAAVYQNALAIAPPDEQLPRGMVAAVANARAVVTAHAQALRAHLTDRLRDLRARYHGEDLERFDESLNILAGMARPYVQQPIMLHYPRLPAIPFYDRAMFPWLEKLEAATPMIRDELRGVLEGPPDDLVPYVAYPPGAPLNQWAALNHSRRWSSFFLWRDGIRHDAACARCPRTAALLDELPLVRQRGFAPTAMFSVLDAHTVIPAHTGSINTRLTVHLPLILPAGCRFRVGNVTREWRMNEAWVFDDTIEHQAWNDSDEVRVILIFDVWNPFLTEPERELVTAMLQARQEYQAADAAG